MVSYRKRSSSLSAIAQAQGRHKVRKRIFDHFAEQLTECERQIVASHFAAYSLHKKDWQGAEFWLELAQPQLFSEIRSIEGVVSRMARTIGLKPTYTIMRISRNTEEIDSECGGFMTFTPSFDGRLIYSLRIYSKHL